MKTMILAAAAALLAPGLALADDLSGTWKINADAGGQAMTIHCNFVQKENALGGTCGLDGVDDKPAPLTGVVDGLNAKWAYDVAFNGEQMHIAYSGNVEGTTITGNMNAAGMEIPFAAVKE